MSTEASLPSRFLFDVRLPFDPRERALREFWVRELAFVVRDTEACREGDCREDGGRRVELVVPLCLLGCVIARLYQEVMSVLSPGMAAHVELDLRMH